MACGLFLCKANIVFVLHRLNRKIPYADWIVSAAAAKVNVHPTLKIRCRSSSNNAIVLNPFESLFDALPLPLPLIDSTFDVLRGASIDQAFTWPVEVLRQLRSEIVDWRINVRGIGIRGDQSAA